MKPLQISFLVSALALFALIPGSAAGRAPLEVQPRRLNLEIEGKASNGFELRVATEGHRRVTLTAAKGPILVSYTTSGRVSRKGIEADFGPVGRISLAFSGHRGRFDTFGLSPDVLRGLGLPPAGPDCRGRAPVREIGRFNGEFEFEGERGFSSLRSRSLKGEVHRFYRRVCDPEGDPFFAPPDPASLIAMLPKLRLTFLAAASRTPERMLKLRVGRFDSAPGHPSDNPLLGLLLGTVFSKATVSERVDGVRIIRSARSISGEKSLTLSQPGVEPVTAALAPEPPLEGTAELTKSAGAPASWSGSLLARLPGLGPIPLTGPDFEVTTCRLVTSLEQVKNNRCLRRAGVDLLRECR